MSTINFMKILVLLIKIKLVCSYSSSSSSDFFAKQSFLIKTGFSNIVWTYINSSHFIQQNVSSSCKSSLSHTIESLNHGTYWSFKLLESSGRVPVDFTGLGYTDPGNYDQCLKLHWIGPNGLREESKYCLISLLPNDEQYSYTKIYTENKLIEKRFGFDFQIGFCLPSTCSNDDLNIIFEKALKPYSWDPVTIRNCDVNTNFIERLMKASTLQKICLSILSILTFTVLYSTYLDKKSKLNNSEVTRKLSWTKHFSIISSYRQITQPNWSTNRMFTLIKYAILLHSIVLVSHTLIWPVFTGAFPFIAVSSKATHFKNNKIPKYINIEWITEGLFVYGGFARSLELWKSVGPETSFTRLLINTFFKLLALSYLMTITMFVQIVLPIFVSGPSGALKRASYACDKSFFKVIFQHNYWIEDPIKDGCVLHYWSVCVEAQYLVLVVFLIYLYKRHPKAALSLNIILLIGSLLFVATNFYMYQYPLYSTIIEMEQTDEYLRYLMNVYARSSMHLWLYMSTTLCTYLVMHDPDSLAKKVCFLKTISQNLNIFGVILTISPLIYLFIINFNQTRITDASYSLFFRILVLIFYSCVMMNTGVEARKCFSYKNKKVENEESNNNDNNSKIGNDQSRISTSQRKVQFYHIVSTILRSTYCIHVPILIMNINSLRYPILTQSELIYFIIKQIIYCLFGGFVFHLFVIGPLNSIFISVKKSKSH